MDREPLALPSGRDLAPVIEIAVVFAHNVLPHPPTFRPYTVYVLRVKMLALSDRFPARTWFLRKRYSECRTLADELSDVKAPEFHPTKFPKRRLSPLEDDVVDERKAGLQDYLNAAVPTMASSALMIKFLNIDDHLRSSEEVENARSHADAANPARLPVHHGFECARCHRSPILGSRFKCVRCHGEDNLDLELCAYCFRDGAHAKEGHGFVEVPHPIAAPAQRRASASSASRSRRRSSSTGSSSEAQLPMTQVARDPSAMARGTSGSGTAAAAAPVPLVPRNGTITARVREQEAEIVRLQQELAAKEIKMQQLQVKADTDDVLMFLRQVHPRVPIPLEVRIRLDRPSVLRLHFACGAGSSRCYYPERDAFVAELSEWQPWLTLAYSAALAKRTTLGLDPAGKRRTLPSEPLAAITEMYDHLAAPRGAAKPTLSDVLRPSLSVSALAQMERHMRDARYYDTMQYDAAHDRWQCFVCAGRSRVRSKVKARQKKILVRDLDGPLALLQDQDRWEARYVTFNQKRLLVYTSKQDTLAKPELVVEVSDILDCRAADPVLTGRAFAFTVTTRSDTVVLASEAQADFEKWVNTISAAVL